VHLINQGSFRGAVEGSLVTIGFDRSAALVLPDGRLARD
jgi:hypothetical protein